MKVKICGITRHEDAFLALSLGADELGFVLAPSPRRVEPERVRSILTALRGEGSLPPFRAIGVFVNEMPSTMRDIILFAGLDAAQIHGDETPVECVGFDFPWYRALRIGTALEAQDLAAAGWDCPRLLVDAAVRESYGGTGKSVGIWSALAARAVARKADKEFFVAGGLGPQNVASVVESINPDGIDVSSGVEEAHGVKSREKLEALFAEISRAEAARAGEERDDASR
jgi:phosphoribosylanthranilate isomerase